MNLSRVLRKAIETNGEAMQTIVAIEELSELQKELTKILRGKMNRDHLIEEMADVAIMYEQICQIYDIDELELSMRVSTKVNRLERRMNGQT